MSQVNKDTRSYEEVFAERKEDLVYLTADSPHELEALDPQHIYIIGALIALPSGVSLY